MAALDVPQGNVDALFRGGELIVDLGCGDGSWLDRIAPRYRTAIGVDINRAPIDERPSGPDDWQFIHADLDAALPFDDGVADAVRANQVIEHVREPAALLTEARRILRPGGLLVVTTPNVRYVSHLIRLIVLGRGPMTSAHEPGASHAWDDGHCHYFTPGDLRRIARSSGFESIGMAALIAPTGRLQLIRPILMRLSAAAPIREFLSGNTLMVAHR